MKVFRLFSILTLICNLALVQCKKPDDVDLSLFAGISAITRSGSGSSSSIRIVFAGDTMLARGVKSMVTDSAGGDYLYPFQYVSGYLQAADYSVVSLESVITDTGSADEKLVSEGLAYRAEPAAINGIVQAGIDMISVSNDHIFDYGRTGMEDCLNRLTAAGIAYTGAGLTFDEAYNAKIIDIKGVKVAFLSYTNIGLETTIRAQSGAGSAQSGVAWFYAKYAGPTIIAAKKQADIVIALLHMGTENTDIPGALQNKYAHFCVDQGADLVIGTHSRVIQPVMSYCSKYLAYSLGNLVYDELTTDTQKGMILEVVVTDKKISRINRKYVRINSGCQPVIQ